MALSNSFGWTADVRWIFSLVLLGALAACGGGSDDPAVAAASEAAPAQTAQPNPAQPAPVTSQPDATLGTTVVPTPVLPVTSPLPTERPPTQPQPTQPPATPPSIVLVPAPAPQPVPEITAPTITSFKASAVSISAGKSVTLSWQVTGADKLSVTPTVGTVTGTSVTAYPTQSTTYELAATTGTLTSRKSVVVGILPTSSTWLTTEKPPQLTNPRLVDVSKLGTQQIVAYSLHCAGLIRQVNLGASEDALFYMTGTAPLRYPLHITGGRNVRVVGLHFDLMTQTGCGVGQLSNLPVASYPRSNIHPRLPGGVAMRMQQSGVSFVEGVFIDMRGHEADCFISRNPAGIIGASAKAQRDFIVQNTHCAGYEGLGKSAVGDGVHGDFWQNQGSPIENLRRVVFENVSARTSMEGIILLRSANGYSGAAELVLRRFDYTWDRRYVGDDSYEQFGLALSGYADKLTMEDVRIDDYRDGGDYFLFNDQRYGSFTGTNIQAHPAIKSGSPPEGAFALPERTGLNYVSPHGGVPGT
jgi:hypothetical protein